MALIDSILNLAALLLWLSWLSLRFDPMAQASAATLAGTLKKADVSGPKRWMLPGALVALLVIRALIYWEVGPAVEWTPSLKLGAITIPFRSDFLDFMLLFSTLGFLLTLAVFYFWLLLLSAANRGMPDTDPLQKLVRLHLGWIERWPGVIKLVLPFWGAGLLWLALHPLLAHLGVIPPTETPSQLVAQAVVIGGLSYLGWKYLIVGILLLHLLNSYVYLGNHPFWGFISASARHLLAPLRWLPLRFGRVDFSPVLGITLVLLVTESVASLPTTKFYREVLYKVTPF
jgi:uncharacterized protein YggT (Ycf19 family)